MVGPRIDEHLHQGSRRLGHALSEEAPLDCSACHPKGPGRVPDNVYSVSRKTLTAGEIDAWRAENLGVESNTARAADPAAELAEFIGSDAR